MKLAMILEYVLLKYLTFNLLVYVQRLTFVIPKIFI